MTFEQEQNLVGEIKKYVTDNLPLNKISDEELQEKVEEIVAQRIGNTYCPIDQRVSIVEQVYSSIRGFGLLDTIIKDDTIQMLAPDLKLRTAVHSRALRSMTEKTGLRRRQ